MRILYVHERFGALGGAEANVLITARELQARGHAVGILHGPSTGKGEEAWGKVFEEKFLIEKPGKPGETIDEALLSFQPEVIYVHKMANLQVLSRLLDSNLPLVRMVHDHDIYCMKSYKYAYFSRQICTRAASLYCVFGCGAFLARNHGPGFPVKIVSYSDKRQEIRMNQRFDRMLVVTRFMREELLKNGFDSDRIVILPPIPPVSTNALRSNFSDRNLIIFAGQIIRGKGVDVLLRALASVRTPFECIILGDGSHRKYCEKLAQRLALNGKVHFRGYVPQEELASFYKECSVVALSSVWPEPIATIGLEVMRYALPVVAFDAGGIKDWLINDHNGVLVPWMDTEAYARALERLLENKNLARQMGENGFKLVSQKYDFQRYISSLEEMFESLVRKAGSPAGSEAILREVPMQAVHSPD